MRKSRAKRTAVECVRDLVRAAWSGAIDWDDPLLSSSALRWTGSDEGQYLLDLPHARAACEGGIRGLPGARIVNERYEEIMAQDGVHVVAGSVSYACAEGDGRRSITAVLREVPDGFELIYQHASDASDREEGRPRASLPEGSLERLPWYAFALHAMRDDDGPMLEVRDVSGESHALRPREIIHLEASRQRTAIHCVDRTVLVNRGIGELASELPKDEFLQVRRGNVVNVAHVVRWDASKVELADGVSVPLPVRRSVAIRNELARKREALAARFREARAADGGIAGKRDAGTIL